MSATACRVASATRSTFDAAVRRKGSRLAFAWKSFVAEKFRYESAARADCDRVSARAPGGQFGNQIGPEFLYQTAHVIGDALDGRWVE